MLPTEIPTPIADAGSAIADIAIATAVILAGVALAAGIHLLSLRIEERLERRGGPGVHLLENGIVAARWPISLGIVLAAVYISLRDVLGLERLNPWLADPRLPEAVAIVLLTWGLANFLSRLVQVYGRGRLPAEEPEGGMSLVDLIALSVKYLVWFIAILYLLIFLNISITPLIAGAGIAGIAIALAAQDVLSNLFGGVIILLDKPLRVGDKVRIDPYTGTVLRLGLRSTRLRTLDGQVATVPNNRITTNIVVNYTAGTGQVSVQVPVTVCYDTPVDESRAALREIAEAAPGTAPPGMGLGPGTVQIAELGRFGPVFVMTFPARDDSDPLAVKDLVYGMVAQAAREGRLTLGCDPNLGPAAADRSAGGGRRRRSSTAGEQDEERDSKRADRG
jgi:MscS family membrane protein